MEEDDWLAVVLLSELNLFGWPRDHREMFSFSLSTQVVKPQGCPTFGKGVRDHDQSILRSKADGHWIVGVRQLCQVLVAPAAFTKHCHGCPGQGHPFCNDCFKILYAIASKRILCPLCMISVGHTVARGQARPVHRLDAATGGLLVLAKTKTSLRALTEAFAKATVLQSLLDKL